MGHPKRLRRRSTERAVTAAAVICALGALLFSLLRSDSTAVVPEPLSPDTIQLPVPTRVVARGESLGETPLTLIAWPKSRLKGAYVTEESALRDSFSTSVLPPLLPIPLSAISRTRLDGNAVVEAIPSGMRAITIKVDAESAVEGWARSGNFVDVILIRTAKDPGAGLESIVIAENVKILSAGSSTTPSPSGDSAPKPPTTITLLTSQEDALRIKTATNLGRLTFALRGSGDRDATTVTSVDQRRVLGSPETPKTVFRGKAKGPDGKMYVLGGDSRWLSTSEKTAGGKP